MFAIFAALELNSVLTIIALASGLIGAAVAIMRIGPDRTHVVVTYQAQILDDLNAENARLRSENSDLRLRVKSCEDRIKLLEDLIQNKVTVIRNE